MFPKSHQTKAFVKSDVGEVLQIWVIRPTVKFWPADNGRCDALCNFGSCSLPIQGEFSKISSDHNFHRVRSRKYLKLG